MTSQIEEHWINKYPIGQFEILRALAMSKRQEYAMPTLT